MPIINGVGRVGIRQRPPQYLLDAYPGAALAFSMRRLNSAYTGPAIRIRRASDNAELDINFVDSSTPSVSNTTSTNYQSGQLKDTVNESEIINFCGNSNGYVVRVYDQSGNGNHLNQTVAASQFKLYFNNGGGWGASGLWERKSNYGGLSGKMAFLSGSYRLTNPIQTGDNWSSFTISSTNGNTAALACDYNASFGYALSTTWALGNYYYRSGNKNKYVFSLNAANVSYPLIGQMYNRSNLITTLNSNNNMMARVNNNDISFVSTNIYTYAGSGIFTQTINDNFFELVLFNSDKSSVNQDIENTILGFYSTSWTAFKG